MDQGCDNTWRFSVTHHRADKVYLVKLFNQCDKTVIPMARLSPGHWSLDLQLSPGQYCFTYFTDENNIIFNNGAEGLAITPPGKPDPRVVIEPLERCICSQFTEHPGQNPLLDRAIQPFIPTCRPAPADSSRPSAWPFPA